MKLRYTGYLNEGDHQGPQLLIHVVPPFKWGHDSIEALRTTVRVLTSALIDFIPNREE